MNGLTANQFRLKFLGAVALYGLWLVFLLWPIWPKFAARLPIATEDTRTVPLFNAWTMGWNAEQLGRGLEQYWDAPIFYPDANTFAYSEPQPLTMLLAPAIWWGSPVIAYNVYLVASLLLNGCFAHLLLRWLGYHWLPTVAGGLMMMALPIIHWQMGVVQLVPLWGILWTLWAMARLLSLAGETGSHGKWIGIELGLAMAVTSWMAIYHALFLTTLLALSTALIGRPLWKRSSLIGLAIAISVCLACTSPMIARMWMVARIDEFVRPAEMVEKLSLYPRDYLAVYGDSLWPSLYATTDRYWRLNPGWAKTVLAVWGFAAAWRTAGLRHWSLFLLSFTCLAFVLSLGWHLQLGTLNLWEWLPSWSPDSSRFAVPFVTDISCR